MKKGNILTLTLVIILLTSCEKEKIVEKEIEKQYSWKLNESFLFDEKIQMNSYADSSNFYTIGINTFSTIKNIEGDTSNLDVEHAVLRFEYPIDYKMPITSKVFAGIGSSFVGFYSSQNPVQGGSSISISMANIDTTFAYFDMPKYSMGEGFVINDNMQCLIPYLQYDTTYKDYKVVSSKPNFLLVQLKVSGDYSDYIDTVSCYKFSVDRLDGSLISLHTIDSDFYITCGEKTFKLTSDLELKEIFDGRLYRLIKKDNTIYGFTDSELYSSSDNGDSWQLLSNVKSDMWRINYTLIDNEIIGFYNSQIFQVKIQSDSIIELENDGLWGNEITSISKFLDKIYVTTLSGLYNKEYSDFFTEKPDK